MHGLSQAVVLGEPDGCSIGKPDRVSKHGGGAVPQPVTCAVPVTGSFARAFALACGARVTPTHSYIEGDDG